MELFQELWNAWWHLFFNILVAINSVIHNPGVSILVFTLLIKLLTVPLTMKSLRSTRNMQQVQPLIKEIQKKYPKDRAKQQEETMKIYQQYGVNPAAGCFPILVQLPVFFALYSALDFTLKHGTETVVMASVLWNPAWVPWADFNVPFLWIPSLAHPDPYYILPIMSGVFQFIQSRMSMPVRDPSQPLDSQTKMMQNMMQFMPIYIIIISLSFPAGTVLYWAMSNVFSAVQQYFITGFGSLPKVPGFGWLPTKAPTPVAPPPVLEPSAKPAKKGLMLRMMDKAVQAQDAQKQSPETEGSEPAVADAAKMAPSNGITKVAHNGKSASVSPSSSKPVTNGPESEPAAQSAPVVTAKYASDLRYKKPESGNGKPASGNGVHHEQLDSAVPTTLPKKKRGKR